MRSETKEPSDNLSSTKPEPSDETALPLNYGICLVDAFTWSIGMAFFSLSTIVPLFLRQLDASNFVIGLLPALINFGYLLPGMLVARQVARLKVAKWWLFNIAILERLPLLAIALLIPILGPPHSRELMWLFLAAFGIHAICLGLNQPAYWVIIGRVIPTKQRGRLFGWAGVVGGILGFGIDPTTRFLLRAGQVSNLHGFGDCFLIGTVILFLGIIGFALLRERPAALAVNKEPKHHVFREALEIWREKPAFRDLIFGQSLLSIAGMSAPFFVLEDSMKFHVSSGMVADFTTIGAVLGSFGSLAWGTWADRHGNKGVLIASQLLALLAVALAVASPASWTFYLIFTSNALSITGISIASYNIVMEFAGDTKRIPIYTVVFNAAVASFRIGAPLIGGMLADRLGYPIVFGVSAVAAAASVYFTVRMREPRIACRNK